MLLRETLYNERKEGYEEGIQKGLKKGRQEGRQEGRQQGLQESILQLLERFGDVPADLRVHITEETDELVLKRWNLLAATAESAEDFRNRM